MGSKTFPGSNNNYTEERGSYNYTCLQTNNVDLTTLPSHESHTVIEDSMVQEKRFTIDVDAYQPNEKWPQMIGSLKLNLKRLKKDFNVFQRTDF